MSLFLKQFSTHSEYDTYINGSDAILPNVSICTIEVHVHYNPFKCEETSTYELVGTPSYPSEVDGASESFDMTFNYKRTDINEECKETVTEDSDTVTVEIGTNPSTASSRTVNGTYDYHGLEIAYTVTQTKYEVKATAKYNVTDTSSPTKIAHSTTSFTAIEIDGVKQSSVTSGYTFDTVGEHTVKYTLTSPTSIGDSAFTWCSSLISIVIPNSVTSIGTEAFRDCRSLTNCTIGSGVTSIGGWAFEDCRSLTSITIPNSVTSIGQSAFNGCSGLTNCTIGSGVTSIGAYAFQNCSSLTSIDIPDSVTSISGNAFSNCSSLTSCTIGSGVTSIGNEAFYKCSGLTSIDIPNSVTSIGNKAFNYCSGLTNCTIGSGVTSIGAYAFWYCTRLTSVTMGSGVTSIGDGAFNRCESLTSIDIPNSVTSIGYYAFDGCRSLTSIDIPNSVTSIGSTAFGSCSSLTSIVCNATTAPTITSNTFQSVHTNGTLTVPIGSSGYDVWMRTSNYYLGKYNWTKVEQ